MRMSVFCEKKMREEETLHRARQEKTIQDGERTAEGVGESERRRREERPRVKERVWDYRMKREG